MKLFMKGTTDVPQGETSFMPDEIFFGIDGTEVTDAVSAGVIRLYCLDNNTGCESVSDGYEWKAEWNSVGLETRNRNRGADFDMEDLKSLLYDKKLVNMVTSFDGKLVQVKVTDLEIIDYSPRRDPETFALSDEQLGEEIEFVA